jgi:hypothetical protein
MHNDLIETIHVSTYRQFWGMVLKGEINFHFETTLIKKWLENTGIDEAFYAFEQAFTHHKHSRSHIYM